MFRKDFRKDFRKSLPLSLPLSLISTLRPNIIYEVEKVRSYSTSSKILKDQPVSLDWMHVKSPVVVVEEEDNLLIDNDKLLRDELKEKEKEKAITNILKPEKFIINGLLFNKLNNEIWIDFSDQDEVDYKEKLICIESILKDIKGIASPGHLNTRDLTDPQFTIFSKLIHHFTDKEVYIKGNKAVDSYVWIYQVLMVNLYNFILKIMYNMMLNKDPEKDSDLIANYESLSGEIFKHIDPSIRIKIQKRGLSIIQNIYTGFDTEYVNKGVEKLNELLSIQLAVNTKTLLKIPKYNEYELSTLNVQTGEEYKIDKSRDEDFKYYMVEKSLNKNIKEIRSLRFKNNDRSIAILIEGLQRLNIPFIEKEDSFVFSFPRTPIQPYIYHENDPKNYSYFKRDKEGNYIKVDDKGKGYSIKNMVDQSNLMGEPYLKSDYDRLIDLLKRISSAIQENWNFKWNQDGNKYKILDPIKTKTLPEEGDLLVKRMQRVNMTSFTDDKVSVTKIRNNYLIAHWTTADLPMFNDFDDLKTQLIDIVNNCFVTLGKPVLISNTNVYVRDSMLLAPQGRKSLESLGSLLGEDFRKVDIVEVLTENQKAELTKNLTPEEKEKINLSLFIKENMDLLLNLDQELFDRYAINDAMIPLVYACYMEDKNFGLKNLGIPLTLSSLGKSFVKYEWELQGYKGYQLSPQYLLGDVSSTLTPKGLSAIGKTGLKLALYIGNYKGGRNEAFMYGIDENQDHIWIDYDLISAYTTAMSLLGNPDYCNGRVISVQELRKMSFNEILYSYIIIQTKFKFKEGVLYPSIAVFENKKGDTVCFPLSGEAILTGPEYLLAKSQGCEFNITDIYYIPFEKYKGKEEDKQGTFIKQPFKEIMKKIQRKRREYPKGSIGNLFEKEMGNSTYGNTVQGTSDKTKFDVKTGENRRIKGSFLSNPIIGSWTTGFIRSVVGECLHKITTKLKGQIMSVTTDGFLTDVENLERKLIGEKAYFINELKILELKIKSDNIFLLDNFEKLKCELSSLNINLEKQNEVISLLSNLKTLHFNLQGKLQELISKLKWEGEDSLLKEYQKIRFDLSGDPSGLEIKHEDTALISVGTRMQIGLKTIKALTGFQSKNYDRESVYELVKDGMRNEDKAFEFIEQTLRSALDIYKKGGHVTQKFKDKLFRVQYDNKRLIVVPEGCKNPKDVSNKIFFSVPVPDKDLCNDLRFLAKYHRQSIYNKHTSVLSGNKYKNYRDIAIRNFLKGLLSNPQRYNLKTKVEKYSELIDFIKNYDNNVKISKQSLSNLKNRPITFKPVPCNKETLDFVKYIKSKYKEFDEKDFFR